MLCIHLTGKQPSDATHGYTYNNISSQSRSSEKRRLAENLQSYLYPVPNTSALVSTIKFLLWVACLVFIMQTAPAALLQRNPLTARMALRNRQERYVLLKRSS